MLFRSKNKNSTNSTPRYFSSTLYTLTASKKHPLHATKQPSHAPAGIAFEYGMPDFARVCRPGIFHVDRTPYIPLLEQSGSVLTFLRPRRMGKSLLLSMLEYYYNVLYKDQFDQLFGHLWIGKHPTEEHNSYLIMTLDFSNLDTGSSVEVFEKSLHDKINEAVVTFKNYYQHLLPFEIVIHEDNAIRSFESMTNAVAGSTYKRKVSKRHTIYLLVAPGATVLSETVIIQIVRSDALISFFLSICFVASSHSFIS